MRIIVHTGKGGVGKTSTSAATALRCAELGLKTIVISTDTAHSLADAIDMKIGPEPVQISENLWAQEIDARYSMEKYWWRLQQYLVRAFAQREGVEEIIAEEVMILPGLEEGAHLLWINQYVEEDEFDVLIVDAAPTAETLRLLSLPETSRWWFDRMVRILGSRATRFLRPFARPILGTDLPEQQELDSIQLLFDTLDKVRQLLGDPEISTMRLVMTPERMVIKETQRTYTYLNLYGYATDAVICNRVIPPEVDDPYFAAWKDLQQKSMTLIDEAFGPLRKLQSPLFESDIGGLDTLRRLADALYGDENPAAFMSKGMSSHRIHQDEATGDYYLTIPLPFADKRELDVYRSADELTIRVGPYRRNIVLPYTLWKYEIGNASFEESALKMRFFKKETTEPDTEPTNVDL
ncbi:MAG: ArsA family ATPase [Chloroflexi bacterium]|nr:ArsA family ATPase [Chloroflexota bacterium]